MDIFAKRYGWSIEYILGLTRRQVRLLMVSAGDHERMPEKDKDESSSGEEAIDLKQQPEEFKVEKKDFEKIRKTVKGLKYRSKVVDKYVGKTIKPEFKNTSNPIVKKRIGPSDAPEPENAKDLINMAIKNQGNFVLGDKLKKKLSRKK